MATSHSLGTSPRNLGLAEEGPSVKSIPRQPPLTPTSPPTPPDSGELPSRVYPCFSLSRPRPMPALPERPARRPAPLEQLRWAESSETASEDRAPTSHVHSAATPSWLSPPASCCPCPLPHPQDPWASSSSRTHTWEAHLPTACPRPLLARPRHCRLVLCIVTGEWKNQGPREGAGRPGQVL